MSKIDKGMINDFKIIIETANEINLPIFLHGGTLLTAVRDKQFIMYEDFDFGVFLKDFIEPVKTEFINRLLNKSFILRKQKKQAHWVSKLWTSIGYGVDFFVFSEGMYSYYHRSWGGYHQFPKECLNILDTIKIFNTKVSIPHNSKIFLEALYGKNWMIPNPKFKKPQDFCCWTKTPEIKSDYFNKILMLNKINETDIDLAIKLFNLLNKNNIFFWIEKNTLIEIITTGEIKTNTIYIGVKTQNDANIINNLTKFSMVNIKININPKRNTKIKQFKNLTINVPKPLTKYIEKITKKTWKQFIQENNIKV